MENNKRNAFKSSIDVIINPLLDNKLSISEQSLTSEQQNQVKSNLGIIEPITYSFIKEFSKSDIIDNKLSVDHQLNSLNVIVSVYDDTSNQILPDEITITDENIVTLNLTNFIETIENTYKVLILSVEGISSIMSTQSESPNLPINENYSVIHQGNYVNLFEKTSEGKYVVGDIESIVDNLEQIKSSTLTKETKTSKVNLEVTYNQDGSQKIELLPINTENLPLNFPNFTITGESDVDANFYVCPDGNENYGYLLILNKKGELLWYKDVGTYATCFRKYRSKTGKNRYCYLQNINDEFPRRENFYFNTKLVVMNENLEVIDEAYLVKGEFSEKGWPTENHDYLYIDDGHYVLANYYQVNNVNPFHCGLQEIKNRKLIWEITTADYPELKTLSHTNTTTDYAHFNSILVDYDDNYIISFRNIGLVKIKKSDKSIMWIIGKNRNDFEGITTDMIPFQQHDVKVVFKDGSYTIFDNFGHSSKSRILRYWLDESSMSAITKEYVTTYSKSNYMGGATLVDFENEIFDIAYGSAFNIAFEEYNFKDSAQKMKMVFSDEHDTYRVWRDL